MLIVLQILLFLAFANAAQGTELRLQLIPATMLVLSNAPLLL